MRTDQINRRDFLKLLSLLPAAYYLPKTKTFPFGQAQANEQNVIILVLDAWSANNISLYGYPRKTTPFLDQLADKAVVYHNHYATANWTFPGTTGLLTGVNTWTHHAYRQNRPFPKAYQEKNLFNLFDSHHRIAYTQNQIADIVLKNMLNTIDDYSPPQEHYVNKKLWLTRLFEQDYDIASVSWVRVAKKIHDGYANSLFLSRLYSVFNAKNEHKIQALEVDYPLGLPAIEEDNHYNLKIPMDWIIEQALDFPQPYLGYFHLLPPHAPYSTRREFYDVFLNDGYHPIDKPEHPFGSKYSYETLAEYRKAYDEYILLVDSEINRLYQYFGQNNVLENTWLIITSDHGELFERGILGHSYASFHNPLVRIPLLIFPPGQQERVDVYTPTSAIDLLPTLLHISGKEVPGWLEGELLPPYDPVPNPLRPIFSMDARYSNHNGPFTNATVMLRKGNYKLSYLFGNQRKYKELNGKALFELYDLEKDPEEMNNLYEKQPNLAQEMREIIFAEMEKHGAR